MNKKEEIIQMLKNNPIKIIKCGDIEIPVEYLKQTTVAVNGDDYIRLQRENKILKENAENNDKVVDKVNWKNQLLKKENKQLKDNWNYIKKMLKEVRKEKFNVNGYCGTCTDVDIDFLLNKMQKLEQGSDSND